MKTFPYDMRLLCEVKAVADIEARLITTLLGSTWTLILREDRFIQVRTKTYYGIELIMHRPVISNLININPCRRSYAVFELPQFGRVSGCVSTDAWLNGVDRKLP